MPTERSIPEGSPHTELSPLTEAELRSSAAVKLTHIQLAEVQANCRGILAEMQSERQRNETLTFRAHSSETECSVLRERLGYTRYRDLIVRLIELVIVGLLAFAIDFAKTGAWKSLAGYLLFSAILIAVIFLIQRGYRSKERN